MGISFLGYIKLGNTSGSPPSELVLANSSGLNRVVEPIQSRAVWGAGWYNAAATVAYADNQMHFEGNAVFEVQYNTAIWNMLIDWIVEQRVTPLTAQISPDGFVNYLYQQVNADPRSGLWNKSAAIRISPEAAITCDVDCLALKRIENVISPGSNYASTFRYNLGNGGPGGTLPADFVSSVRNPSPFNRNPIPGWQAKAAVTWPNAPAFWADGSQPYGMALRETDFTINNNTTLIKACTGDRIPLAIIVGTIEATGSIQLWRDGAIPDPYGDQNNPSTFTASGANINLFLAGGASPAVTFGGVVLSTDTYNVANGNEPVSRTFGFFGVGDTTYPPCRLFALS